MSGRVKLFDIDIMKKMTEFQRVAFLKALAVMAGTDGSFDAHEQDFIINIGTVFGLSTAEINDALGNVTVQAVLEGASQIKDRQIALEWLKELCLLAHTDNELSDQEVLFLGKIGEAMGIELSKIEEISSWVIDYIIWRDREKIIFEKI